MDIHTNIENVFAVPIVEFNARNLRTKYWSIRTKCNKLFSIAIKIEIFNATLVNMWRLTRVKSVNVHQMNHFVQQITVLILMTFEIAESLS